MRIGLFLIVLMGCLIALGYFVSDSLKLHQDIQSLNEALRKAQLERAQLEQAYQQESTQRQVCEQDNLVLKTNAANLSRELLQLRSDKAMLNQQLQALGQGTSQVLPLSLSGMGGLTIAVLLFVTCRMRSKMRLLSSSAGHKYVQLSDNELTWLIRYRRSHAASPSGDR